MGVPNLGMYKLLNLFPKVKSIKCHGKVNTVDIEKYVNMACGTVKNLEIREANIDLNRLFKYDPKLVHLAGKKGYHWNTSQLRSLTLIDSRMLLKSTDVKTMSYSLVNIKALDFSGSHPSKFPSKLIAELLTALEDLESFTALRSPKIANDVLDALGSNCLKLNTLSLGGLANDYNEELSLEGVESLLKGKRLKHVKFEYCTKIGDQAIKALALGFH